MTFKCKWNTRQHSGVKRPHAVATFWILYKLNEELRNFIFYKSFTLVFNWFPDIFCGALSRKKWLSQCTPFVFEMSSGEFILSAYRLHWDDFYFAFPLVITRFIELAMKMHKPIDIIKEDQLIFENLYWNISWCSSWSVYGIRWFGSESHIRICAYCNIRV